MHKRVIKHGKIKLKTKGREYNNREWFNTSRMTVLLCPVGLTEPSTCDNLGIAMTALFQRGNSYLEELKAMNCTLQVRRREAVILQCSQSNQYISKCHPTISSHVPGHHLLDLEEIDTCTMYQHIHLYLPPAAFH